MKFPYKLLLIYSFGILFMIVFNAMFGGNTFKLISKIGFWIFHLVFIAFTILIGIAIALFKGDKKYLSRSVVVTSIVAYVVLSISLSSIHIRDWYNEKYYGNIESNELYLKWDDSPYIKEKRIAYKLLSEKFSNENLITIRSISAEPIDTIISSRLVYTISGSKGIFSASCILINDIGQIVNYDQPLTQKEIDSLDSIRREVIKSFEEAKSHMSDSVRNIVEQDFKDFK